MPRITRNALLLLVAGFAGPALALDPTQPFSTYLRTHFNSENGLDAGVVDDIVQSQDGFLWLIENGQSLARFDGRHFTRIDYPAHVVALAVAPDGDLWVGTTEDLERIPAAALNQFGSLPAISYHPGAGASSRITCLKFSRSGVLWVGTNGGLYRFEHGSFSPAIPGQHIIRIAEASNGHMLVITSQGIAEWDGSQAVPTPELAAQLGVKPDEVYHVLEDSRGVTWFCTTMGVARRIGGSVEKLPTYGPNGHGAFRVYEDPQGNVWIAKIEGLFRATATGLELVVPGMNVRYMYGDRDGNLWIGTNGDGLFRLKDRAVRMFTTADGLPNNVIMTVLAGQDGRIWTGANCGGLSVFDGQRFRTYNEGDGLLNSCVWALAEDANHDLWIGTYGGGAFRFHGGSFTQYSKPQGLASNKVTGIVPARDGSLWFMTRGGLTRMRNGQIRNYTAADGLSGNFPLKLYEDRTGGIWVGTTKGVDQMSGDRFVNFSSVPKTAVFPLGEDRSGGFYFSLDPTAGVFRIENQRPISVAPNIVATNMVETSEGDLWLSGNGILRVPHGGLRRSRSLDEPLDYAPFGGADGLASTQASAGQPNSALARDGKLWVATSQGVAMLDLATLPRTNRKPTIYMGAITVGRNLQPPGQDLVLPAGTHHVELQFDAIEISAPEKIRLQYRLDSVDSEWLDTSHPAHAIYSNLPAGTHAFHLRACNRDGIWDQAGMVYNITQQPYFYETPSFQLAIAAAGGLLLLGFYRLRLRQAAARLNARLDERLAERTRIARELHDTLLQSFHGLMFRFQAARNMLPRRPEEAIQALDAALERTELAIAEGRDAIQELRSEPSVRCDLEQLLMAIGQEMDGCQNTSLDAASFRVTVEGKRRTLSPILQDEVYRIAHELIGNAFQHARARQIEAEIRYDDRLFRLRIRDDGRGINPNVLQEGGCAGHWGLPGVRERAKQIGAQLDFWSEDGAGTEVQVTVPAAVAYAKSPDAAGFKLFRKKAGTHAD